MKRLKELYEKYLSGSEIDEIAEQIAEAASITTGSSPVQVIKSLSSGMRKPGLLLSNDKLKSIGWQISTSHQEGLKKTISKIRQI